MTRTMKSGVIYGLLCLSLVLGGCATNGSWEKPKQVTCAAVGAVVGGVAGGLVGNNQASGETAAGLGIGAASGAAFGYLFCAPEEAKAKPKASPQAQASGAPTEGTAPLTVDFRGSGSDPDGRIVSFAWDLGDGNRASGDRVTHTYQEAGTYTAQFTATDNDGMTGTDRVRIRVAAAEAAPAPTPVARKIVLRGVNFDFDSAAIRADAQVILDTAVEVLGESPNVRVNVAGHTDSTGPEAYNQGLSERRAQSVYDYLVSNGISGSRLSTDGFGETQPVADNSTRDGRAQNRRVELNVSQ